MSMRGRATLGAIVLGSGLLMVVGASSTKSTAIIKYQRAVGRGEHAEAPSSSGPHVVMALGWVAAAAGAVLLGFTLRAMSRQLGEIQSSVESQLRMEAAVKRESKPKP